MSEKVTPREARGLAVAEMEIAEHSDEYVSDRPNDQPNGHPAGLPAPSGSGAPAKRPPIQVGTYSRSPSALPVIRAETSALRRHASKPWLRAWVAQNAGGSAARQMPTAGGPATVTERSLAHHAVVVGSTGSGKTRLALHLLSEQMQRGRSVVALDPKVETISHLLASAREAGVPPERVVLLTPGDLARGVPGWNPLASGLPLQLVAADLVSVLEKSTTSWGPRLADILANALVVLAAHGLSVFELPRLLGYDEYRDALLRKPPVRQGTEDGVAYREAAAFFEREYGRWTKADRIAASGPVLNKTREILRGAFFLSLLCAERNTLDFAALWRRQEVVLVHLDGSVLGSDGARILSGLLAHSLHRTAMRCGHEGPNSVVLAVDELGVQEEFLGSALASILAVARSKNLRLLAVCQHLAQVSPALREALLSQSAVQAFFRLGHSDAKIVGDALAAEEPDRVAEASVRVAATDKETGRHHIAVMKHDVRDGDGKPLSADPLLWRTLVWRELFPAKRNAIGLPQPAFPSLIDQLKSIAARAGVTRLYVLAADSGKPVEITDYVDGLGPFEYWFDGPDPVRLVVAFPRPKVASVRRLSAPARSRMSAQELMRLGRQQAILRVRDARMPPVSIRVADVPDPDPGDAAEVERYARESLRARGRSWPDAEREIAARERAVEALAKREAVTTTEQSRPTKPVEQKSTAPEKDGDGAARPKPATATRPLRRSAPLTIGRIADDGSIS